MSDDNQLNRNDINNQSPNANEENQNQNQIQNQNQQNELILEISSIPTRFPFELKFFLYRETLSLINFFLLSHSIIIMISILGVLVLNYNFDYKIIFISIIIFCLAVLIFYSYNHKINSKFLR